MSFDVSLTSVDVVREINAHGLFPLLYLEPKVTEGYLCITEQKNHGFVLYS